MVDLVPVGQVEALGAGAPAAFLAAAADIQLGRAMAQVEAQRWAVAAEALPQLQHMPPQAPEARA